MSTPEMARFPELRADEHSNFALVVIALNRGAFTRVGDLFKAASDEAAKTCFEQLTWDTKAAHGDAQGLETDDLLIISNRDMALAIDRDQFQLRGLYNPRTNKEFVSISSDAPAIDPVAVTLLTADHRELGAFGFAQARRRHEWRTTDDGIELVLHWRGLNVPDEPDSLDVEAVVRAGPEGMTQWSCRVTNRSARLGLRAIEFPLIGPLHAGTEEDPTDYSAQAEANPTARSGEIESMAMFQYQAYYGSRGGVYYGPQDSHWYEKKIRGRAQANTRTATLGHTYIAVNSHGEQVKTFEPTYETAVGVFEGDWYDAARRYRRWATKQPWCARGTLTERDDLPDWIRSVDLWTQGGGYTQEAFDDTLRVGLNFGRPMSVWVTHWMIHRFDNKYPDYFPPKMGEDAFIKAIAEGHRHGLTYMPYINAFIYATDAPSYTDEAAANGAKYLDGRPRGGIIAYLDNYLPYIAMCPATKFWQDKIAEIGAKIIQEYDCDGIYYDQVDNYRMECGDPTHGHPLGGGNSWTTGVREMYNRVRREALAATGKKVVFSSEFWHEQYIDEASVPLQQYSTNDSMYAHIRDVVYHDYVAALGFGLRGRPLLPFIGSIFITGAPGPTGLNGENLLGGEKPNAGALALLHYLSDCRRQFARKYLNLGARLRDPRIFTELPLIDRGGMARLMPAVITTAWEAADGDVACFFMNISNEAREFKYAIDLSRFALDSVGTYTVTRHELGETTVVEQQNAGRLRRTASLERAKLFMIQFSRETSGKSRNLP